MPIGSDAPAEEAEALAALRDGDQTAFAALSERYRPQLRVHCYRFIGSVEDAEDLVQETFLRAWRGRAAFEGRSLFRTWLYRIATNVCLTALERRPRRVLPRDVAAPVTAATDASEARSEPEWAPDIPWLQPYPDHLLDPIAPRELEPDARVVSRETIELAYLAALQHLPPRQRAVLLLREVLDWSAQETASLLETSVASVNSALQRARATIRGRLPERESAPVVAPTTEERVLLQRFMDAWERTDAAALTTLLHEDATWSMPPAALWFQGRASIERLFALYPMAGHGEVRVLPTAANRQPAAAVYIRPPGHSEYRLTSVQLLRVDCGEITAITSFSPELCRSFDLPAAL